MSIVFGEVRWKVKKAVVQEKTLLAGFISNEVDVEGVTGPTYIDVPTGLASFLLDVLKWSSDLGEISFFLDKAEGKWVLGAVVIDSDGDDVCSSLLWYYTTSRLPAWVGR
jgi:hypothetical protein